MGTHVAHVTRQSAAVKERRAKLMMRKLREKQHSTMEAQEADGQRGVDVLGPSGSTYSPRLVFAKDGRQRRKNKEHNSFQGTLGSKGSESNSSSIHSSGEKGETIIAKYESPGVD